MNNYEKSLKKIQITRFILSIIASVICVLMFVFLEGIISFLGQKTLSIIVIVFCLLLIITPILLRKIENYFSFKKDEINYKLIRETYHNGYISQVASDTESGKLVSTFLSNRPMKFKKSYTNIIDGIPYITFEFKYKMKLVMIIFSDTDARLTIGVLLHQCYVIYKDVKNIDQLYISLIKEINL